MYKLPFFIVNIKYFDHSLIPLSCPFSLTLISFFVITLFIVFCETKTSIIPVKTYTGGVKMLLSQAWKTYESDKRIEGFSSQTLKAYRLQSCLHIRYFTDVAIESLSTNQLKEYLAESSEHLKPSSLAHRIRFSGPCFGGHMKRDTFPQTQLIRLRNQKSGNEYPSSLQKERLNILGKLVKCHWRKRCLSLCSQLAAVLVKLSL